MQQVRNLDYHEVCVLSAGSGRTSKSIIYIVNAFKVLSDRDFPHESGRFTGFSFFILFDNSSNLS